MQAVIEEELNEYEYVDAPVLLSSPHDEVIDPLTCKPLLIGCSGGGGHNAAIKAMLALFPSEKITYYRPVAHQRNTTSLSQLSIFAGARMYEYSVFKRLATQSGLPILPEYPVLIEAIQALTTSTDRPYIDMLLDANSVGYESAAIWNIFQREDKKDELAKLIRLQVHSDAASYQDVYAYFFNLLVQADIQEAPYTEIISTQALGLAALCDAVIEYNRLYRRNVIIHQYMTDLSTDGAVHFFKPLSRLTPRQQGQIKLYAVGMNATVLGSFFRQGTHFLGLYAVAPKMNPMVRPEFYSSTLQHHDHFDVKVTLIPNGHLPIDIDAGEKVACIMLGSQAGTDTTRYISTLLEHDIDKLIIFGGNNPLIAKKVSDLSAFASKLVLLSAPQDAAFIVSLMTRCSIVVIRSGGLSIMEQLAMPHPHGQLILLHYAESGEDGMRSGITWEDGNANQFIAMMADEPVIIKKTYPCDADAVIRAYFNSEAEETCEWSLI